VVLVGLGPADELDADTVRTAAASVAQATERNGGTVAWLLDDSLPQTEQARADVDGLVRSTHDPGRCDPDAAPDHPRNRPAPAGGRAQGRHTPARRLVIRHDPPAAKGDVPLGLVGKAITFDTGGISITPALYKEDMKGDMPGGGAVVDSMGVIAELGLPLRALAVVAASENAVGGGAFRPGDILTAMNGKTIEIPNTDA